METKLVDAGPKEGILVIQESLSDKILKWIVTIYALSFVISSLSMALICIYSLPDKTVQAKTGILYFLSGAFVLGVFVFVVWKNWITERS